MQTSTATQVAPKAPRPRADAVRNRERIVAAARELFVLHGADVPLDDIARRAGVGNATVYRNFPDRDALIREVVCSVLDRTVRAGRDALVAEGDDAFAALERFAHSAADERLSALCPMLTHAFDQYHPDLEAARGRIERIVEVLMARARAAGQLRPDVGVGDLMLAVAQLSRPPAGRDSLSCGPDDRLGHRQLQLFLDGLRTPARTTLPGTPVTMEDLRQA